MNELHFLNIRKRFRLNTILDGLELSLCAGRCTLLTGDNGAGKTTLLRILGGFEKPDNFQVDTGFCVLNWRQYRKTLQGSVLYLHQQPYMFEGSVRANLAYALPHALPKSEQVERIRMALHWGGLERIADAPAKQLSGGECQRVALARAWLRQPGILLLDEPTANMDKEARLRTVSLLRQLRDEGKTLLIASHDPDYFSSLVNDHLHLHTGKLQAVTGAPQFANIMPLHHAAT
ncbi:ABC transporter ATP-binding protein [Thiothrix nivea]|uniref:ABC transporter related protein n=1 Tax=Thiothrix nivea (strain ATCC 35100 / DSM 5205 / JP2) TaxID=870187 RepID=A0A656HF53_THINJ|nr:ABC transporter ATP-binding protein [Thiothrix nivea]EIJ34832.1 ABC transporter related protein [Thiothrix nivea DSM 5205]